MKTAKRKPERRYFLVSLDYLSPELEDRSIMALSDDKFMTESEKQGLVFSENTFIQHFNNTDSFSTNMFLRILTV